MRKNQPVDLSHKERLKEIIIITGKLSANKFAESIGVQQSDVSKILLGKKNISPAVAYAIVKKHNHFSLLWIMDGIGQMLMSEKVSEKIQRIETNFNRNLFAIGRVFRDFGNN